jgi:hypothetical protein
MAPYTALLFSLLLCIPLCTSKYSGELLACEPFRGRGGDNFHDLTPPKKGSDQDIFTSKNGYRAKIWGEYDLGLQVLLTGGQNHLARNGISLAGMSVMRIAIDADVRQPRLDLRYLVKSGTTCVANIPSKQIRDVYYEDTV